MEWNSINKGILVGKNNKNQANKHFRQITNVSLFFSSITLQLPTEDDQTFQPHFLKTLTNIKISTK